MGILDSIKDKLRGGEQQDYYDDQYDDQYYDEQGYAGDPQPTHAEAPRGNHLLGNTPRPEAQSVSVYTRSGRRVGASAGYAPEPAPVVPQRSYADPAPVAAPSYDPSVPSVELGTKTISRTVSGQLPPYVLKPVSYDDVQTVVRRVRTNQPVVVVFRNTNIDTAKRILDFCFGLSFGLDGEVSELGDRVFVVLPHGVQLSQADIDKLVADGDLVR